MKAALLKCLACRHYFWCNIMDFASDQETTTDLPKVCGDCDGSSIRSNLQGKTPRQIYVQSRGERELQKSLTRKNEAEAKLLEERLARMVKEK